MLINGQGRFENYVTLNSPRERISPIQTGEVAAGSSVNMVPAFRTREVSTHSSGAYSLPGPGVTLRHGSRTLVMVGDDTTVVPPYYLVYDDVQVNDEASLYEQLYVGDADVIVREHGAGALVLARRYTGPWLAPVSGAQGEARLEFDLPEAGNYQVWVYLKGKYGPFAFRLGPHTRNTTVGARTTRENCWQWVPAGPALALEAGRQTLAVLPRAMIFAQVALIPEAQAQTYAGWGDLPEGSLARSCSEAVISGESWKLESPARPAAELLVASLNRGPGADGGGYLQLPHAFLRAGPDDAASRRLVKRQPEANFLTLIYPYLRDGSNRRFAGRRAAQSLPGRMPPIRCRSRRRSWSCGGSTAMARRKYSFISARLTRGSRSNLGIEALPEQAPPARGAAPVVVF